MKDSIKIYSLPSCGMCSMLKQTLNDHHIEYNICEDTEEMRKLNITSVPILSVNGTLYSLKDALKMIREGEIY